MNHTSDTVRQDFLLGGSTNNVHPVWLHLIIPNKTERLQMNKGPNLLQLQWVIWRRVNRCFVNVAQQSHQYIYRFAWCRVPIN